MILKRKISLLLCIGVLAVIIPCVFSFIYLGYKKELAIIPVANPELLAAGYEVIEENVQFRHYFNPRRPDSYGVYFELFDSYGNLIIEGESRALVCSYTDNNDIISLWWQDGTGTNKMQFYNSVVNVLSEQYRDVLYFTDHYVVYPEGVDFLIVQDIFDSRLYDKIQIDEPLNVPNIFLLYENISIYNNVLTFSYYSQNKSEAIIVDHDISF